MEPSTYHPMLNISVIPQVRHKLILLEPWLITLQISIDNFYLLFIVQLIFWNLPKTHTLQKKGGFHYRRATRDTWLLWFSTDYMVQSFKREITWQHLHQPFILWCCVALYFWFAFHFWIINWVFGINGHFMLGLFKGNHMISI